jgi:hypothetical protein
MKLCRTVDILSILLTSINYIYISLVKGAYNTTATPLYPLRARIFGAYIQVAFHASLQLFLMRCQYVDGLAIAKLKLQGTYEARST